MPKYRFKGEMLRNAMRQLWIQHVRERGAWRGKPRPIARPASWRR